MEKGSSVMANMVMQQSRNNPFFNRKKVMDRIINLDDDNLMKLGQITY